MFFSIPLSYRGIFVDFQTSIHNYLCIIEFMKKKVAYDKD